MMKKINLSAYHPILDIQDNMVFASNGNVIMGYRVSLPEIYSLSEKDFEDLHASWFQAFKSLPAGTVIQKQDIYRKSTYTAEELPCDTFLQQATHHYFKNRECLQHQSYLFFVLPLDKHLKASKYVNPFRKTEKGIHKKLDHQVREFIGSVKDAVSFINNSRKIYLSPLDQEAILEFTHSYFNGFHQDVDTDIRLDQKGIAIGDYHFDVLAINSEQCFGESLQSSKVNEKFTSDHFTFHQGFIDGLGLDLDEDHIINHILYLDDKHKWRKVLEKKSRSFPRAPTSEPKTK